MLRAAGLFLVAGLAVAAVSSARAGSGPRTFTASGEIGVISASGSRVAFDAGPPDKCVPATVWNEATGAVTQLHDPCSSDAVFQDLTLAGDTAIWWDFSSGNHVYCDDVYAQPVSSPKAHALGICDGTMGDTYFQFAGDRSIVAISDYTFCEADCTGANGQLIPDGDYGVEVRRLREARTVPVLAGRDFRTFLDARDWRVAVIEPKATLTLYDSNGRRRWAVRGVTGVASAWIAGDSIVVRQKHEVRVYTAAGAGIARPLPSGARVEGVVGGLVLYRTGAMLRLLRLKDGRDRSLVKNIGMLGGQLTTAGVFYAAGKTVTFFPIADVLRKLR